MVRSTDERDVVYTFGLTHALKLYSITRNAACTYVWGRGATPWYSPFNFHLCLIRIIQFIMVYLWFFSRCYTVMPAVNKIPTLKNIRFLFFFWFLLNKILQILHHKISIIKPLKHLIWDLTIEQIICAH